MYNIMRLMTLHVMLPYAPVAMKEWWRVLLSINRVSYGWHVSIGVI